MTALLMNVTNNRDKVAPRGRFPRFNPSSATYKLSDLGQVTAPLCASLYSAVKGR